MHILQSRWNQPNCSIVCATDGGLKDQVGTSSYAIFLPQDESAVIEGFAGEYQPLPSASSTRQELLGQLGVEYWINRLSKRWGTPRRPIRMELITDSKASIDIMSNVEAILGVGDTLRAEMDVALKIYAQRNSRQWVQRSVTKVQSHIEQFQVPDEYAWMCNERADTLATSAREVYTEDRVKTLPPIMWDGTIAVCKIGGLDVNNDLFGQLRLSMTGDTMRGFLINKYEWSERVFRDIDWTAHQREIQKVPPGRKVTLVKYIHGWLATKARRSREGVFNNAMCPLCGEDEIRVHIFECQSAQMEAIRQPRWRKFFRDIDNITMAGCREVLQVGLSTVVGEVPASELRTSWSQELQSAYEAQEEVGWAHILYGRIVSHWGSLADAQEITEDWKH